MASTFTNLLYHVVFSTKERRPVITPPRRTELYPYIGGIIRNQDAILLAIGGIEDHLHILAKFRADTSVADMLRLIKTNSSKWANERTDLGPWFGWQTGYAAFTVSESQVASVRAYIENQAEHHRTVGFQDEFLALLKKHGVEYEERFLWD